MRCSYMEIDLDLFKENINKIKEYVKDKTIIPVIKANAYGTYINTRLDIIDDFDIVGVALVKEARELRELGYKKNILVLNEPYITDIDDIVKYNITVGVSDYNFINEIKDMNIKIHLEIETGMNRTGINIKDIDKYINLIKNSKLTLEGVYTHLSSADYDYEYTKKQLDTFKKAVTILKKDFDIKYIHSSSSNGLLNFDDGISNAVRPGLVMYGYETYPGMHKKIGVKPIAKLVSTITFLKEIEKGESVSYSRRYKTTKKTKIATVPLGYADGIRRDLSNKGCVLINGKKAKIIGSVCMDSFMCDVTSIKDAKVGDKVYIWDNESILLDDIAKISKTINYEIISTISSRVPRRFKKSV